MALQLATSVTSGSTVSANAGVDNLIVVPVDPIAALTIETPPAPNDNDRFALNINGQVTSTSFITPGGEAIQAPISAEFGYASGAVYAWVYSATANKWFHIG